MKTVYRLVYLMLFISSFCCSQNKEKFAEQFFMNSNVYFKLKNFSKDNKILIVDPNQYLTNKKLIFNNKDLKIFVIPEKSEDYDFLIKKTIINTNLAFVGMWNRDSVTALCFYPFLSEFTPDKWIVEEITTRSIK